MGGDNWSLDESVARWRDENRFQSDWKGWLDLRGKRKDNDSLLVWTTGRMTMPFNLICIVELETSFGGRGKGEAEMRKTRTKVTEFHLHWLCLQCLCCFQIKKRGDFGWFYGSETWRKDLSWTYWFSGHQHRHRIVPAIIFAISTKALFFSFSFFKPFLTCMLVFISFSKNWKQRYDHETQQWPHSTASSMGEGRQGTRNPGVRGRGQEEIDLLKGF